MKNYLLSIIQDLESLYKCKFKPTKEFYKFTGIKQKLFGQILRNEKQPTTSQAYKLCKLFKVPIDKLVELPKQTELFKPEFAVIPFNSLEEIERFYIEKLGNKQKEEFAPILKTLQKQ